jgi:hypothetical protein
VFPLLTRRCWISLHLHSVGHHGAFTLFMMSLIDGCVVATNFIFSRCQFWIYSGQLVFFRLAAIAALMAFVSISSWYGILTVTGLLNSPSYLLSHSFQMSRLWLNSVFIPGLFLTLHRNAISSSVAFLRCFWPTLILAPSPLQSVQIGCAENTQSTLRGENFARPVTYRTSSRCAALARAPRRGRRIAR